MKKTIGMDDLVAAFMAHISDKYAEPQEFSTKLDVLLSEKRKRAEPAEYADMLEKNIVFFNDLIVEGEALIDLLLRPKKKGRGGGEKIDLNELLAEMERKARARNDERIQKIFGADGEVELTGGTALDDPSFIAKLEFDYKYLMALKILLFEFLSALDTVLKEYEVDPGEGDAGRRIIDSIKMAANFYIGNIDITSGNNGSTEVM
jgi:hypothetical protein